MLAAAGADPFRRVNRSVRIGGHATSIELEAAFWAALDAMAEREGVATPKLLATLHEESAELQAGVASFASILRTVCLLRLGAAA